MSEPGIIYDFDPHSLPREYLEAIGLVAAASAQTESVLQDFIGCLLGIDNVQALALTTHMAAPLKDHVIRAIVELDAPNASTVDEVDDLLDRVDNALTQRNTIVHNSLVMHPDGRVLSHRLRARGSLQLELVPVSVEEIRQSASLIYEAGMDIMRFMMVRGIAPKFRKAPIREPLNRKKKARTERRERLGRNY